MNYPLISEYIESIKCAEDNFATLTNFRPVLDESGNPIMSSGNFAVVFKMKDVQDGKLYAVKCFLKEQEGRDFAYKLISEELQSIQSPYILKVRYIEKELFVDTAQSDETEYPVLVMDWVEGETLSSFLQREEHNYDRYDAEGKMMMLFELRCLPYNFLRMASWLLKQPFAHGDIKPDNIIIRPDGTCVLVDYDGMYVPAMQGMKMQCVGTPNFRYPLKEKQMFDKSLDNYSISIIALSLCAFALHSSMIFDSEDLCLITEKESFRLYEHSIFKDEVLMSDNLFRELLGIYLHTLCQNTLEPDYFDKAISTYLYPSDYDILSTKATDFDLEFYWEDKYGVRYSLDGRKVISASKDLKDVDYIVREGVLTICDQSFQAKGLHSITLPGSVIAIGNRAFANNDEMEYCNIPASVKYIYDNNPWGGCFNIKKMNCLSPLFTIKDGILYSSDFNIAYGLIYWHYDIFIDYRVKKISANAFWSAREKFSSYIKNITINNSLKIEEAAFSYCRSAKFKMAAPIEDIKIEAFKHCELLEKIDLSKVHVIPEEAFAYCRNLKEIILSSKLEIVSNEAFYKCISLKKIDIPDSVIHISERSLSGCTSLTEINVGNMNRNYCSIDGVLFNKSVTKLIKYPAGRRDREYKIPNSVCEIGNGAFSDCRFIESVICNNKLLYFEKNAFQDCPNLKNYHLYISENADKIHVRHLGHFLFTLKNANKETKDKGYNLIHQAATLNEAEAQYLLACCYKDGSYGEINSQKYIYWLRLAAANKSYRAMSELGKELLIGKNIPIDYNKAYQLFREIEEKTYFSETDFFNLFAGLIAPLGLFYEKGLIVNKDVNRAIEYYKKGTNVFIMGDSFSEYHLGRCYENGIGVDCDLEKASEYYSLAKKHKYPGASEALERMRRRKHLFLNTNKSTD